MRSLLISLAVGLVVAGAACFSERVGPDNPIVPTGECRIPANVIIGGNQVIPIINFTFSRDSIVVPVGSTVTWVNCEPDGTEPHTSTSAGSVAWTSPDLIPGAVFSLTFTTAGEYNYHCTPHPYMVGKIVVQ